MLYDGKRPDELSDDELDAAALYCVRMRDQAKAIVDLNDAGLAELVGEYERRLARGPLN